jgi:hypothetical protein
MTQIEPVPYSPSDSKDKDPLAAILQIIEMILDNDGIDVEDKDLKRLIEEIKKL